MLLKHGFSEADYYALGLNLGLSKETIDEIEREHKKDAAKCLLECLKYWLQQTDDVKSKGGPTIFALNKALLEMRENKVADGIHKESKMYLISVTFSNCLYIYIYIEHPACEILMHYEAKFQAALPQNVVYLKAEGIICKMVLPSSHAEKAQVLLEAVREGVCLNHHNLKKLAYVLKKMDSTAAIGAAILERYGK